MSLALIAEREFRTYVATWSFWLSLAVAPVAAATALFFSGSHALPVSIQGGDARLVWAATQALDEVSRLEGKSLIVGPRGAVLILSRQSPQSVETSFGDDFPLSPTGRAMVGLVMERDMARAQGRGAAFSVRERALQGAAGPDTTKLSRLATMTMLWLTLTGSLGMLLQAIARERANRALESLLASAQGWEIVAGKLLGVGAVSLLVLFAWLGSAAGFSAFLPDQTGLAGKVLRDLAQPLTLLRDVLIYFCAFGFFGAATLALGAMARDSTSAQNLARPLFLLLVVAFFVALASPAGVPSWLIYIPPLTPFLLLVNSASDVALISQAVLLGMLIVASALMMLLAARFLSVSPGIYQIFKGNSPKPQPLV